MAKVIAVINQKGGVGKTTTAHAIGAWLQIKKKQKVLFIDLDQQGNLTYATNSSHSCLSGVWSTSIPLPVLSPFDCQPAAAAASPLAWLLQIYSYAVG